MEKTPPYNSAYYKEEENVPLSKFHIDVIAEILCDHLDRKLTADPPTYEEDHYKLVNHIYKKLTGQCHHNELSFNYDRIHCFNEQKEEEK